MRFFAALIVSLAAAFAQAAAAQDIPVRVGRLAYTEGPVSVYQDPELGWDKAYVNSPVTSENSVWTDRGARAELRVGAIAVRQDELTQVDVARLDEDDFDAFLPRGAANIRVRYKERADHITFSTPHALFMIEADGRYRIDVDEDRQQSRFTVFAGRASMESSSGRIPVEAGGMVIVSDGGQYGFERARADRFDQWADARDRQWQDSNARRYVSSDMTGYEELDRYGTWSQDADYGAVWYPTQVASGWAPYRYGHWSYVRPWGWTWIDDQPWGYAPSHYGRWVQVSNRWAWAPGYAVRERPVWAPALVGFFGGAGFSVSVASAAPVGWYPLAPWERYDPWYRTSTVYVTSVNRHVVDRRPSWYRGSGDQWRTWNRERATTVVNRDAFVNRRAVQGSMVRVAPEVLQRAPVVSNAQVVQQVLPQRNEVVRITQQNAANVAAPRRSMGASRDNSVARQNGQVASQSSQAGQVVRPEFRRRGGAPQPVPATALPASAPPVIQQAPQRQEAQGQNPMARSVPEQQQQQVIQQQQREAQQREAQGRQQQGEAQRAAREQQQREAQQREAQARQQQEQVQRAAREQQQQQGEAQRAGREQQQREAQQREAQARQQQEQAQRATREQQQRDAQQRAQQETAQRSAREQQQAQERAAREAQQQQQRAAREAQQKQEQNAARAQQQQQAQERAQRQPQPQPEAKPQPQPQEKQQANPAARGEDRGRAREKDEKDKDKDKEKDKR